MLLNFLECMDFGSESGRADLNRRPLQPHCSALPDCATLRKFTYVIIQAKFLVLVLFLQEFLFLQVQIELVLVLLPFL